MGRKTKKQKVDKLRMGATIGDIWRQAHGASQPQLSHYLGEISDFSMTRPWAPDPWAPTSPTALTAPKTDALTVTKSDMQEMLVASGAISMRM
ncbi:Hypothetical predicted protein [Pelobates cultripes]|uniref:Uncharacterized protein n=1 Tax=Pelobates cultripes TaxID=61616 RepID=A0AAD1WPU1_PELCU|nr:Hypothetical predicted protein [Pelobates cultripes]